MDLESANLKAMVSTIVDTAHPNRVLVFGSVARGTTGPDSDVDLLVVMPNGTHRRRTTESLLKALVGCGIAKDIVVATEQDVLEDRNNENLVLCTALREGKELYRAA